MSIYEYIEYNECAYTVWKALKQNLKWAASYGNAVYNIYSKNVTFIEISSNT